MKAKIFFKGLAAIALLGLPIVASAQDYDDDIYYNPSKSTKTKTVKTTKTVSQNNTYVSQPNYAAAGTYSFNTGNTRDVDEYNRRGAYAVADTALAASDSTYVDEFGFTRRLERFHNPNVVVNTGDADLIDYYYSTDASQQDCGTTVNVYVYDDPFYYSSWRYPYYGWSRWNRWCYSPWYWDTYYGWGGLGWGWFDPLFSWSWGWGPGFGWGYTWSPAHWFGGGHFAGGGMHHSTPGAGRVHSASGIGSSISNARRSSYGLNRNVGNVGNGSSWSRPGNMGRGTGSSSVGSYSSSLRGTGSSSSVIGTTSGRGRYGSSSSNSSNYNSNSSSTRRSTSSYNSNSSSTRSSGSGSSWGGSRGGGGGSMGGGSHGGGGGGGRGRR
jgi:hypothetical protein